MALIVARDALYWNLTIRVVGYDQIMHLLKMMLKIGGKIGVPQGSVLSPVMSNVYLNEVDKMLEKAKEVTKAQGKYYQLEYARFADDPGVLVSNHPHQDKLWEQVNRRLREELTKLKVQINEEKTQYLNLDKGETFGFGGFDYRKIKTRTGKWGVLYQPKKQAKQKLKDRLKEVFGHNVSQPLTKIRDAINPILRGWVNYFKVGNSSKAFAEVKRWLALKIRRHLMRAMKRKGYGWKRWSTRGLLAMYNIYSDFTVTSWKAKPAVKRISFDKKLLGERSAGNRHATFDEAGTGNTTPKARAPVLDPTDLDLCQ